MINFEQWEGFEGRIWKEEVNVRDFIQKNYTQYDGDESFLAGPTEATDKLWGALQKLQQENTEKLEALGQQYTAKLEELQQSTEVLDELQKHVDEKLSTTEENVHKECVKVYRNVQAVVVEENEKQTEAIAAKVKENLGGKLNGVLGVSIAAVVLTVADIVLHVLSILHIF